MNKITWIIVQIFWIFLKFNQIATELDLNKLDNEHVKLSRYNTNMNVKYFYNSNTIIVSNKYGDEPPIIETQDANITLEYGTNFTLKCKSRVPIEWIIPGFIKNVIGTAQITEETDYLFIATIEFNDVTAKNVGEYFCIKKFELEEKFENFAELKSKFIASSIYIFVDDPYNLLAPIIDNTFTINEFEIHRIPCRGTSENVEVQLIKDDEDSSSSIKIISYDTKYGFEVIAMEKNNAGNYKCIAKNNTDDERIINIRINSQISSIALQNDATKNFVMIGDNFTLSYGISSVTEDDFIMYKWKLPNNNIAVKDNRVIFSETPGNKIIIYNANYEDQGSYSCDIYYDGQLIRIPSKWVNIINPNDNFIFLKKSTGRILQNLLTGSFSVNWIIPYKIYTSFEPEFIWYNNFGEKIETTTNDNDADKYFINKTDDYIFFQINNVTIFDIGNYTLEMENAKTEETYKVQLIVLEKPKIIMNSVSVKVNQLVELQCNCSSYPPSNITFIYNPCTIESVWPNCDSNSYKLDNKIDIKIFSSTFQYATMMFMPNSSGIVKCIASNEEGSDEVTAEVIVKDLNEAMEVWTISLNYKISLDDSLTIVCGVLNYNFTGDLKWYRDNETVEATSDVVIREYSTNFSFRTEILFERITEEDSGIYECRVTINDTELFESKSIPLSVNGPLAPSIVRTTTPIEEKSIGDEVKFECVFIGSPVPVIEWFKDDIPIDRNMTRMSIHSKNSILELRFIKAKDQGLYQCKGANRFGSESVNWSLKVNTNSPDPEDEEDEDTSNNYLLFCGISLLIILILIVTIVFLSIELKKLKKKTSILNMFFNGCVEQINPLNSKNAKVIKEIKRLQKSNPKTDRESKI